MQGKSLFDFPIHLGLGAKAIAEPKFTGFDWYEDYGERHAGDEVVCCIQGHMTLHQELPDGNQQSRELGPGEYAINPPGAWHTADADEPVVALFITVGKGTTHRPR